MKCIRPIAFLIVLIYAQSPALVTVVGHTIRNNASVALTAYSIATYFPSNQAQSANPNVMHPSDETITYHDNIVDEGERQLAPKQAVTLVFVNAPEPSYVQFLGAVFADGSTYGEPDSVRQILERRKLVLHAFQDALSKLEAALQEHTPREQLIKEFKGFREAYMDRVPFGEYYGYVTEPYRRILDCLAREEVYPQGYEKVGSPVPWEEAIVPVLSTLRQRVNRLLTSRPSLDTPGRGAAAY